MKRGFLILSDMTWFLVFIVFAVLIFAIGFYKLSVSMPGLNEQATNVSDANFIATTLPRMPAGQDTFTSVIRNIASQHAIDSSDTATGGYLAYNQFLDDVFSNQGNNPLFTSSAEFGPMDYMIVLQEGNSLLPATCREYPVTAGARDQFGSVINMCARIRNAGARWRTDPDTGMQVPMYSTTSISGGLDDPRVDVGTSFIPTQNGLVTLHVYIWRGKMQ